MPELLPQRSRLHECLRAIRRVCRPPLLLFLFFLAVYAFTSAGRLDSSDGQVVAATSRALYDTHTMSVALTTPGAVAGVQGLGYSKYGIVQSLIELPFVALGEHISAWTHLPVLANSVSMVDFTVAFTNSLVTALGCVLFYLLAVRLGASRRRAIALTLVYGLGTLAWAYAKTDFTEPSQALALLCAFYALLRARSGARSRWLLVAGIALGVALLAKIALAVAMPAFTVYVLLLTLAGEGALNDRQRLRLGSTWWAIGRDQALLWAPVACAVLLTLGINVLRFGKPLDFGYGRDAADKPFSGSIPMGIYGLLFSFDTGIIFYATPVVLGVLGLRRFYRRHTREALFLALLILAMLILYGGFGYWAGLSAYGPRYLVPVLPFLLLPAVDAVPNITRPQQMRWLSASLLTLIVLAGCFEEVLGVTVCFREYTILTCNVFPCAQSFDPTQSQLLYDLWLFRRILAYNLLKHVPTVTLAAYPYGATPSGRPSWQENFLSQAGYFWWTELPQQHHALVVGALLCAIVAIPALLGLLWWMFRAGAVAEDIASPALAPVSA